MQTSSHTNSELFVHENEVPTHLSISIFNVFIRGCDSSGVLEEEPSHGHSDGVAVDISGPSDVRGTAAMKTLSFPLFSEPVSLRLPHLLHLS